MPSLLGFWVDSQVVWNHKDKLVCPEASSFTWVQVAEAVQSQTLNVQTHLQLDRDGLDECLGKQPAVLLSCNSANTHVPAE